jgi:hypothetical protein
MKIKTTQIIKKLMPNSKNFRVRVKNQRKLSEELVRRLWWKFEVIEYCDNKEEFDSSVLKIKGYFFQSRLCVTKFLSCNAHCSSAHVGGTPRHCPHATMDGQDYTTNTGSTLWY